MCSILDIEYLVLTIKGGNTDWQVQGMEYWSILNAFYLQRDDGDMG